MQYSYGPSGFPYNKSGKVAEGLVGITQTDSARDRWCLTYNERAQLSKDSKAMFGILAELEEGSSQKDLEKTRMKKDEEDVLKLVAQFSAKYEVFCQTENLVVITTGDVASEEVKQDLLEAKRKVKKNCKSLSIRPQTFMKPSNSKSRRPLRLCTRYMYQLATARKSSRQTGIF